MGFNRKKATFGGKGAIVTDEEEPIAFSDNRFISIPLEIETASIPMTETIFLRLHP